MFRVRAFACGKTRFSAMAFGKEKFECGMDEEEMRG